MKILHSILPSLVLFLAFVATPALAKDYTHNKTGVSSYDTVAYFTEGKARRGSGWHVTEYQGVTYAFVSDENKELFLANPEKYLPAYGGWCAYGMALGKKFVTDPEAWKIVDGKLYLNLDKDIQKKWFEDIPGYIQKADANWQEVRDTAPGDL